MQVVVTGSSGPIGNALCSHLASSGHHVVRVVRRPVRPGEVALAWDPEAGTIDARGLEGADAVVHLAGAGVLSRPLAHFAGASVVRQTDQQWPNARDVDQARPRLPL